MCDTIVAIVAGDTFVTRVCRMFYFLFPTYPPPASRPTLRLRFARCGAVRRLCTVSQIYTPAPRAPSHKPSPAPLRCVLRNYCYNPRPCVLQARALVPRSPAFQPHRRFRLTLNRTPRPWCCSPAPTGVVPFGFCRLLGSGVCAVFASVFAWGHSPPKCAAWTHYLLSISIVIATFVQYTYVDIIFVVSNKCSLQ